MGVLTGIPTSDPYANISFSEYIEKVEDRLALLEEESLCERRMFELMGDNEEIVELIRLMLHFKVL